MNKVQPVKETGWTVIETEFDPARLHHKETVFATGNGYLTVRGTFEEGKQYHIIHS